MKLEKFIIKNSSILGNLELDFTDGKGNIMDNIIFAGENGCGKSTLLKIIYTMIDMNNMHNKTPQNLMPPNVSINEYREFHFVLTPEELKELTPTLPSYEKALHPIPAFNKLILVPAYYPSKIHSGPAVLYQGIDKLIQLTDRDINIGALLYSTVKTVFSDIEVNFSSGKINSITNSDLDSKGIFKETSTGNLATQIKQLLIDIDVLDATEYRNWARATGKHEVKRLDVRIRRFKNAFHYMFPTKRLAGIVDRDVVFQENGRLNKIDELSSGEKQIVYRGGFILKNLGSNHNSIICIDEPELSLHPKWQQKILNFYKNLFSYEDGEQTSQLFFATHSPFIIHNRGKNNKVIVLKKDDSGKIIVDSEPKFHSYTDEETIKKAFDIEFNTSINIPIVYVEGITDEKYLTKALELEGITKDKILVKCVGRETKDGAKFSGKNALSVMKEVFISNPHELKGYRILLYDPEEVNINNEDLGLLKIYRIPLNNSNNLYKKGIENLLLLQSNFKKNDFIRTERVVVKEDDYGISQNFEKNHFDKVKLCDWICNEIPKNEQKKYLKKIFDLTRQIKELVEFK